MKSVAGSEEEGEGSTQASITKESLLHGFGGAPSAKNEFLKYILLPASDTVSKSSSSDLGPVFQHLKTARFYNF